MGQCEEVLIIDPGEPTSGEHIAPILWAVRRGDVEPGYDNDQAEDDDPGCSDDLDDGT